jgi:hypothetical protein
MSQGRNQRASRKLPIVSFALELVVYAALMTGYVFLVLGFLEGVLRTVYATNKTIYAFAALFLIIGQGVVLEILTTALLQFLESWSDRG